MNEQKKVIEKIRKLLALSKSSNQFEAELAAERANDLMKKYQLSVSEVELDDLKKTNIVEEWYKTPILRRWVVTLARSCAILFDGEVLIPKPFGGNIWFVGYPEDIEAMKNLFEHLYKSWKSFSKIDRKIAKKTSIQEGTGWSRGDGIRFMNSHGLAYASTLCRRCRALAESRKEEVHESSSTGRDLIVLKDQTLKEYGEQKGWSGRSFKTEASSDKGYHAGRAAGERAPLGGAIRDNSS